MYLENVIVLLQTLVLLLVLGQRELLPSDFIPESRHLVAHDAHVPLDLHHFFLEAKVIIVNKKNEKTKTRIEKTFPLTEINKNDI